MPDEDDILRAIATIRSRSDLIATRNGLRGPTVESWLAEVEKLHRGGKAEEGSLRVSLRVLERWLCPIPELSEVHALLQQETSGRNQRPA